MKVFKLTIAWGIALMLGGLLASCGSSKSDDDDDDTPQGLVVRSTSGTYNMNGTWRNCYLSGSVANIVDYTFSGNTITISNYEEASCADAGTTTIFEPDQFDIVAEGEESAAEWVNGSGVSSPSPIDGSTTPVTATKVKQSTSGFTVSADLYYVDDSVTPPELYNAYNSDNDATTYDASLSDSSSIYKFN